MTALTPTEREIALAALKYIKGLRPEPIGESGFQTGPQALLDAARRTAATAYAALLKEKGE